MVAGKGFTSGVFGEPDVFAVIGYCIHGCKKHLRGVIQPWQINRLRVERSMRASEVSALFVGQFKRQPGIFCVLRQVGG